MEYRQKDDYYLYLAEFKSGNKIKEAVDQSLNAYQTTSTTVEKRAANLDGHTQYSTHSTCTVAFESPPMHCTNASWNHTLNFYERKCPLKGFRNCMHWVSIIVCTKPKCMHRNLELRDTITIGSRMAGALNDHFGKGLHQDCMQWETLRRTTSYPQRLCLITDSASAWKITVIKNWTVFTAKSFAVDLNEDKVEDPPREPHVERDLALIKPNAVPSKRVEIMREV